MVLVVAALAVIAGVLVYRQATSGGSSEPTASSPRAAAERFAGTYARFLDGTAPASALSSATARVQRVARGAGVIPADARTGAARVDKLALEWVSGAPTARVAGAVGAGGHRFEFNAGMTYDGSRWAVVNLTPVDVPTVLARAPRRPTPGPALERAARRFALAYAGYRTGADASVPGASGTIRAQIAAGKDPLAKLASTSSRPSVRSLQFGPAQDAVVAVTARLRIGSAGPRFTFLLSRHGSSWRPSSFLEAAA